MTKEKPKAQMGRPFDLERQDRRFERILDLIGTGCSQAEAARRIGMHPRTLEKALARDADKRKDIQAARKERRDPLHKEIINIINNGERDSDRIAAYNAFMKYDTAEEERVIRHEHAHTLEVDPDTIKSIMELQEVAKQRQLEAGTVDAVSWEESDPLPLGDLDAHPIPDQPPGSAA